MVNAVIVATFIFLVAVSMTMVGKGGGNFYVVILALTGAPMHEAATTGQFILFTASVAAITVYHRNNTVVWPLAVTVGGLMAISAFFGGYFSHVFSGFVLKVLFAAMLDRGRTHARADPKHHWQETKVTIRRCHSDRP